ncbi:MAG: CopG family transcriptional regulator [Ornithinimicrobium sp.]
MRTTINLSDALAEAAKERAAAEGRTFTSLVEEGLRRVLEQSEDRAQVELPVFEPPTPGRGMLVDIADTQALWEALDADGAR